MALPRKWVSLGTADTLNADVKRALEDASGGYAIRTKRGHGVVYVGESHVGHMWRTLLRHFQTDRFRSDLVRFKRSEDYEVAWKVTSRGKRAKTNGDERAMAVQAEWIEGFRAAGHKLHNVDDGLSADDDSFDFGANVEPEGAFDSVLNPEPRGPAKPRGVLHELGVLTRLRVGAPSSVELAWSMRGAPVLAYDDDGRLFVVYVGDVERPSTAAEVKEYKRTHWGVAGRGDVSGGGIAPVPFVDRGPAVSVTYTTKKLGDRNLTDYVHAFGEGSSRRCIWPRVLAHVCRGGCKATCAARGTIALEGGSYKVHGRGIVG